MSKELENYNKPKEVDEDLVIAVPPLPTDKPDIKLLGDGITVRTTPFCEACVHSSKCMFDITDEGCPFVIVDRDELLFRIIRAGKRRDGSVECDKIYDQLCDTFRKAYWAENMDIDIAMNMYDVCDSCDGSGVIIGNHHINICEKCGGIGVVPAKLESGFQYAYYVYHHNGTSLSVIDIYTDKDIADNVAKDTGSDCIKITISKQLDDIIRNIPSDVSINTRNLVAVDVENNNAIVHVGSFKDIHDAMHLPYYIDVERYSNGRIVVESVERFNNGNCVVSKTEMDDIQNIIVGHVLSDAPTYASYGGADGLIQAYAAKYPTIHAIRKNLQEHIHTDTLAYVMADMFDDVLDKVISDFAKIGMTLDKTMAAIVIHNSSLTTDTADTIAKIMDSSAVGVFIVEYVVLLKEFADLTEK